MDLSELIMNIQQLAPQLASTCCVINGAFMTLEDVEKMGYDEFLYRSKINMPLRLYKYFSNAENDKEGSKVNYSNKTLMKMFNMIGIGERAGSGIPDIYQVWENEGWPMPVVEESYNPDRTRLSLEFSKKQAIKTSDKKQAIKTSDKNKLRKTQEKEELIREYLRQNGLSKTSEIAEYIELSPARTRALLSDMTDVVVEGANKNRKYRLATED